MRLFTIEDDVSPSLRHPTDPTLFKVSEGNAMEYVTLDYLNKVCPLVECSFSLWQGSYNDGEYVPAPPVRYEQMTREAAFTRIIYALNRREPGVNPFGYRYCDVRTREIEGAPL